jgi:hypothetical protein
VTRARAALEQHVRRTLEILYATESEAARMRRELDQASARPLCACRLQAFDWINAWVMEARIAHRLAERALAIFLESRSVR